MQQTAPSSRERDLGYAAPNPPAYTLPLVSQEITEKNYGDLLNAWRAKSTYADLEQYTLFLRSFHPVTLAEKKFAQEAATFLLPYAASRQALDDAKASKDDPEYAVSQFRAYHRRKNDCFTYMLRLIDRVKRYDSEDAGTVFELARGITYSTKNPIPFGPPAKLAQLRDDNDIFLTAQTYNLKEMKKGFAIQVGDWVKVNHSRTGHNHWAVAVEVKGQLMMVSRRSASIDIEPIEDFTAFASEIEVRRLGGFSGYGQHFDVALTKEGNRKRNISKNIPPVYAITLQKGPEPEPVIPVKVKKDG